LIVWNHTFDIEDLVEFSTDGLLYSSLVIRADPRFSVWIDLFEQLLILFLLADPK